MSISEKQQEKNERKIKKIYKRSLRSCTGSLIIYRKLRNNIKEFDYSIDKVLSELDVYEKNLVKKIADIQVVLQKKGM